MEPFRIIVSRDRQEADHNAASACLQSDKVMEMRGERRGGGNYRGSLNATWFL